MKMICKGCSKEFECATRRYNFNTKKGINIFCSKICYREFKKSSTIERCSNCGKDIKISNSRKKRSKTGKVYCSKTCSTSNNNRLFKKWINHPKYKSGISRYRDIKLESVENPTCEKCGFSNVIALDIHHKDRNRENNNIENLQILCCNCHRIEHRNKNENVV